MTIRRIQEYCQEIKYRLSYNDCGDICSTYEICGKPISIRFEYPEYDGEETGWIYQILRCGHIRCVKEQDRISHDSRNVLWDGLLPFQKDFVEFAEKANLRVCLRDEMGLGKTVQVISLARENSDKFTANMTKYMVIVTPVGGVYQWQEECNYWFGLTNGNLKSMDQLQLSPQVVVTTGQKINPLSKVIIIPWSRLGDKKVKEQIFKVGIASIVVDEAHFYKSERAARTENLLEFVREARRHNPNHPLIPMTGTLVMNRIMEMKVWLNLLDPYNFPSWDRVDAYCLHDRTTGKALSLHPRLRDRFFEITSKYMIGRKKSEVNIPLPEIKYEKFLIDPQEYRENRRFAIEYNEEIDKLEEALNNPADNPYSSILGIMQKLRHATGRLKLLGAAVEIDKWLTEHPNEKLAVGCEFIDVRETLKTFLAEYNPLSMSDEDAKEKDEIERAFRDGKSRLLLCSIRSAGIGRNLQFCKNAIILERQWNKAVEDQFAQRFWRIVKDEKNRIKTHFGPEDTVTVTTYQGINTFDDYFEPMIHLKGIIVDSAEENAEDLPEANFIMELAREVVRNRIKWVGM